MAGKMLRCALHDRLGSCITAQTRPVTRRPYSSRSAIAG